MKNLRIHLALILVSLLFGVNYIFSKHILEYVSAPAWAFARAFVSAVLLTAMAFPQIKKTRFTKSQYFWIFVAGIFGVFVNQIAYFQGLARTTPTHSAVINTCVPIFTLLFGIMFGSETLNFRRLSGMTLSVIGIFIVLDVGNLQLRSQYFMGDLLTVVNALSFSIYLVLSRELAKNVRPFVITAGMFVAGTSLMAFYGGQDAMQTSWGALPSSVFYAMAFGILGATIATYYLNNWALSQVDSSAVALYIYIQPVVAGLLSRWIYNEVLTMKLIVASGLVFIGVALGAWPRRKEELQRV